jgi:SAM-dependent methyltransferase
VERSEYDKLDRVEDRMWWFAALHTNLLMLASQAPCEALSLPILDAGCGTGGFIARLAGRYRDIAIFGLDLDPEACCRAAAKSGRPVCAGSVNQLPFADRSVAVIFSADVLCHEAVDEKRALRQFHRCLTDGGRLIVNLPAYCWMLSRHDRAVRNIRRYTASGLRRLLHATGFQLIYISYWNAALFPIMATARKLFDRRRAAASDVELYPTPVDMFCRLVTQIETGVLRRSIRLPFGGSVLAIAAKADTGHV